MANKSGMEVLKEMKFKASIRVLVALVLAFGLHGLFASAMAAEKPPKVGPVTLNAHPASLDGKTVVLRWNGKYNGDLYLNRVGELLAQQVKNVKIVKLWETDKATADVSKNGEVSEQTAVTIAKLKPALVIAAQAD
jgi:hypothetical protein